LNSVVKLRNFYLRLIENGPDSALGWLVYAGLWPFSYLYRFIMWVRACAYTFGVKSVYRSSVPVISVGNLTSGGTGKTPVVDVLIKYLVSQGLKVAVVSRGYKGTFKGESLLASHNHSITATEVGDEPFLLAMRNPDANVYVARRRRYGVAAAESDGADCIVLDDAFQHLAVARDLNLVLLDARKPFGNSALIPAGCLRESRTALQRADLLILTHSNGEKVNLSTSIDVVKCRHRFSDYLVDLTGQQHPWSRVQNRRCLAFVGIARPEDFFLKLNAAGCELHDTWALADHQEYSQEVLRKINQACQNVDFLLTTEKDAVKLKGITFLKPCLAVPLELEFDNFEIVAQKLETVIGGTL
jgi:tetraacyldisaccharide 4'-kinase